MELDECFPFVVNFFVPFLVLGLDSTVCPCLRETFVEFMVLWERLGEGE